MIPLFRLKTVLFGLAVTLLFSATATAQNAETFTINDIKIEQTADEFLLKIEGGSPPTYTMYELFDPLRIVLDIADAELGQGTVLPANLPQGPIENLKCNSLDDQQPSIARLEVFLTADRGYSVERQGNSIVVNFAKTSVTASEVQELAKPADSVEIEPLKEAATLYNIEVDTSNPNSTLIIINTDGPVLKFEEARLKKSSGRPARMYVDLPGIMLPGKMIQQEVGTSISRIRAAQRKDAVRIVFDSALDELFEYDITKTANGLHITIHEPSAATPILAEIIEKQATASTDIEKMPEMSFNADELIKPIIAATTSKKSTLAKKETASSKKKTADENASNSEKQVPKGPQDTFAFAGYQKQKITVDFFKIDLHNVFRLFGEISDLNIVVDEGVNGTLTLALNEVPWDFALDIIINLKDLQKEERFNTIVISPKAKEFKWPKTATDTIAFKADGSVDKVEAISVKQRIDTPKEVIEAKKLILQASILDKDGKGEKALPFYEQAFKLWPENVQLANRISSICLVQLGINAKAVYYAKASLALEPGNTEAALQAAIGLANMKKIDDAKKYFDIAISGDMPRSEALISYASFAEELKSFGGALALLAKHEELYGETLDTMVAKARILDKKGETAMAVEAYRTILLSGYDIPADLNHFIKGRIAAAIN
ncbi:MAG: AMIN domain-containing protein [Desulfobulbaceae bacterium]|nr:AMIN domain-containing protein [Desulfobulbaceae bacterium]